jgi:hypothetical protein
MSAGGAATNPGFQRDASNHGHSAPLSWRVLFHFDDTTDSAIGLCSFAISDWAGWNSGRFGERSVPSAP